MIINNFCLKKRITEPFLIERKRCVTSLIEKVASRSFRDELLARGLTFFEFWISRPDPLLDVLLEASVLLRCCSEGWRASSSLSCTEVTIAASLFPRQAPKRAHLCVAGCWLYRRRSPRRTSVADAPRWIHRRSDCLATYGSLLSSAIRVYLERLVPMDNLNFPLIDAREILNHFRSVNRNSHSGLTYLILSLTDNNYFFMIRFESLQPYHIFSYCLYLR